ncbi:MAG: DUF4038 domain-containing protein [Planctomycetia bacterium]|nr:DUF4038 domain-containing protein [Planctomycetia bacterium]
MNKCWICAAVGLFLFFGDLAGAAETAHANRVVEITLTSKKVYDNPYQDVSLDAVFTGPGDQKFRLPAFWAGGNRWCFRYSSTLPGKVTWRTDCSDVANAELHAATGTIDVTEAKDENPLYQHGPIRVAKDRRHFEHADGTPFFWLGDTWWKGLCGRIEWDGFQKLTADRKAKGFTVVQIVAGPYPDERPFDPRWANEGGMPYEKDYVRVNPAYFDYADRRIQHLADAGIAPAIVGGWGWHMPKVGVEKFNRHWRYLIARYGAYPVIWIVGGEAGGQPWTDVARYVRKTDPFHRLATVHPYQSARRSLTDESVIDFDMLQTGHNDWGTAWGNAPGAELSLMASTVSKVTAAYSKTPPMPVLVGEVGYEGHMMGNRQETQRFTFWASMLNGAAGHTYGAGGIWQMNSDTVRGAEYEFTPWSEAMNLPGSGQLGLAKKILQEYPWWRFEPHPEWVDPHGTTLLEPHDKWYDEQKEWKTRGGRFDLPFAAGIPGEVRIVYIPGNHFYNWKPPAVKGLEPDASYHAFYLDPVSGKRFALGNLIRPAMQQELSTVEPPTGSKAERPLVLNENPNLFPAVQVPAVTPLEGDTYKPPRLPAPQDWLLVLERLRPAGKSQ